VINLIPIQSVGTPGQDILYQLLKERTPEQSISHKSMPTMQEHIDFIESRPYLAWYFIQDEDIVGSIYLTNQREIGISIFKHYQSSGYGKEAVKALMKRYPGRFLANVAPENEPSRDFFKGLGFKKIQVTYEADC